LLLQKNSMKTITKQAITIVELIVVITILAVLWTISFLSFQSYTLHSRDVVRISDLNNIKSTLEYAQLELGVYALPDNSTDITFSWTTIWTQWIFWKRAQTQTKRLDKVPLDPLTQNEYTFSITANKTEYELWAMIESSDSLSHNTPQYNQTLNNTFADWDERVSYILWNYNWQVLKTSTWWFDYVLAVPTLIASDLTSTDITQIISNKKLAVKWSRNLPSSYGNQTTPEDAEDLQFVNSSDIIAYKWKFSDLQTLQSERVTLASNIQKAYSWTLIATQWDISPVTSIVINTTSPSTQTKKVADETVVYRLGLELKEEVVSSEDGVEEWTLPEDLTQLFATDSQFTENWETNNCDPADMTVVDVAPGTDTIYAANGGNYTIPENTILKLEEGTYIDLLISMNNCTAIIWEWEDTKFFTTNYTGYNLYNQSSKSNFIVYWMNFDGKNDWNGWTHNSNIEWIKIQTWNNTLVNLNIINSYQRGVSFTWDNLVLSNITVSNSEDRQWISWSGDNLMISNITVLDSNEIGVLINTNDSIFRNMNITNSWRIGFQLYWDNNIAKNINIKKSGSNWMLINWTGGHYSDIFIDEPSTTFVGYWLNIFVVSNSVFENITVSGSKYHWIYIWNNSNNNIFENIYSSFNDRNWVEIYDNSDINSFINITAHDNGEYGIYNRSQDVGNSFENITVYNNTSKWMYSWNIKTLSGSILAYNNGDSWIQITSWGIEDFEITDITAYNNASYWIRLKWDWTYPLQGEMIAYENSLWMLLEWFSGATNDFSINAYDNTSFGVYLEEVHWLNLTESNLSLTWNAWWIAFQESHNNSLSNISITDSISSSSQSIRNDSNSNNNTFTDIEIITGWYYWFQSSWDNTYASNISISWTPRVWMRASWDNSIYTNISIENSRVEWVNGGWNNLTLSWVTVSNPWQYGLNLTSWWDNLTLSNIDISGGSHGWLKTWKLTNSTFSNINVSDSLYTGVSTYWDNLIFTDITVTNSVSSGFVISTWINNVLNNVISSWNGWNWIHIVANSWSDFDNLVSYSNGWEWIMLSSNMINNSFNNITSYNNNWYWLETKKYSWSSWNKYYGILHLYNNTEWNLEGTDTNDWILAPWTDGLNGWSNWVLNTNP